jgi:hypothetical protein
LIQPVTRRWRREREANTGDKLLRLFVETAGHKTVEKREREANTGDKLLRLFVDTAGHKTVAKRDREKPIPGISC